MSKSIYEDNPKEFCKQNWFTMFSFKLTRSLFHYRNGRRMKGDPVSATHSEKDYHEKHYEHYSKVCQCNKEDLPTINDRTPICNTSSSNSTVGDKCQVGYIQVFLLTENRSIIITHSRIWPYFFSYLPTCEVNLIEVLEIMAQMGPCIILLSLKPTKMTSDFILSYILEKSYRGRHHSEISKTNTKTMTSSVWMRLNAPPGFSRVSKNLEDQIEDRSEEFQH